jgi:hypothetical protein
MQKGDKKGTQGHVKKMCAWEHEKCSPKSVVDSSVGRALPFSHEGHQFISRHGVLFISL